MARRAPVEVLAPWITLAVASCAQSLGGTATDAALAPERSPREELPDAGALRDGPPSIDRGPLAEVGAQDVAPRDAGALPDVGAATDAVAGGTTCASPAVFDGDLLRTAVDLAGLPSEPAPCGASSHTGPLRYFQVLVGPRQSVVAVATSELSPFGQVYLSDGCSGGACLAATSFLGGVPFATSAGWTNTDRVARAVWVAVGRGSPGPPQSPLNLAVRRFGRSSNAACAAAMPLDDGVEVPLQESLGGGESAPRCEGGPARPALWYRATVPGASRVDLQWTVPAGSPDWLEGRIYAGCDGVCLPARQRTTPDGRGTVLSWTNEDTAPREVRWAINPQEVSAATVFSVTATSALPPLGDTCLRPIDIAPDTARRSEVATLSREAAPGCDLDPGRRELFVRYYALDVPARQTVVASARTTDDAEVSVAARRGCGADCVGSARSAGAAELRWSNPTDAPQRLILSVEIRGGAPFDLSVALRP